MKKIGVLLLTGIFLCGCGTAYTPERETVSDEWTISAMAEPRQVQVKLPGQQEAGVIDPSEGQLYLADDYEITIERLEGGDLDKTLQAVCGYPRDKLTVMQTNQDGVSRYDFVWACMGENGERLGRGVILDDGAYHYVMTALRDVGSQQSIQVVWSEVFQSFSAV